MNIAAGNLQFPNTGGSVLGGEIPAGKSVEEQRVERIADLERENADLVKDLADAHRKLNVQSERISELFQENERMRAELNKEEITKPER